MLRGKLKLSSTDFEKRKKRKASWVLEPTELLSFLGLKEEPMGSSQPPSPTSFFLDSCALGQNLENSYFIGVDEVGAGCLAGPLVVVAAGISLRNLLELELFSQLLDLEVGDSKKMPRAAREKASQKAEKMDFIEKEILLISPKEIDELNIYQARMKGLGEAVLNLSKRLGVHSRSSFVFVDGPQRPSALDPQEWRLLECLKHGDAKNFMIALASVFAKVYRDEWMIRLSQEYPEYYWDSNVGYPTPAHKQALFDHGPSPWHRKSFLGFLLAKGLENGAENQKDCFPVQDFCEHSSEGELG